MALAGEMRRLTQEFVDSFDDRIAKVMDIRSNMTEQMSRFHAEHAQMADHQREQLTNYVAGLRENVSTMLKSLDAAHKSMAMKMNEDLAAGRTKLASDVSSMRGELQADQHKAHKTWTSFNTTMRKRRANKFDAPKATAPTATRADDLTTIEGIGPARRQQLAKMGIHTFRQLAASTPDKIRKAMGQAGRLVNVDAWIKESLKRSS